MSPFVRLVRLLQEKNLHITAAESCTGGLFCSSLVDVPHASKVFGYGFVTYAVEAKCGVLGVSAADVDRFGVVSRQVAAQMAAGAAKRAGAEVAVGITGYAGPRASAHDDTVGTVCFGFYVNGAVSTAVLRFGDVGREAVRRQSARFAALRLAGLIEKAAEQ